VSVRASVIYLTCGPLVAWWLWRCTCDHEVAGSTTGRWSVFTRVCLCHRAVASTGRRRWTRCRLDRGLPPYQVTSWSIHPFDHNRHGHWLTEAVVCLRAAPRVQLSASGEMDDCRVCRDTLRSHVPRLARCRWLSEKRYTNPAFIWVYFSMTFPKGRWFLFLEEIALMTSTSNNSRFLRPRTLGWNCLVTVIDYDGPCLSWHVLTYVCMKHRTIVYVTLLAYFMDFNGVTFWSLMLVSCLKLMCAIVVNKTIYFLHCSQYFILVIS